MILSILNILCLPIMCVLWYFASFVMAYFRKVFHSKFSMQIFQLREGIWFGIHNSTESTMLCNVWLNSQQWSLYKTRWYFVIGFTILSSTWSKLYAAIMLSAAWCNMRSSFEEGWLIRPYNKRIWLLSSYICLNH